MAVTTSRPGRWLVPFPPDGLRWPPRLFLTKGTTQWQNLSMGWLRRVLGKQTHYASAHDLIEAHRPFINKNRALQSLGACAARSPSSHRPR